MKFHLTRVSTNAKVGPIPTAVISNESCPDACEYKGNGCYAETGPLALHWNKVSGGDRGVDFPEFLEQVESLPENQLWRYGVAGDLPGKGDRIHNGDLKKLVAANKGKRGFTYTHKPPQKWDNFRAITLANVQGFTINLSSNSMAHADELLRNRPTVLLDGFADSEMEIPWPVVTILPHDFGEPWKYEDPVSGKTKTARRWKHTRTPDGHLVVQCPAEYSAAQCATCGGSDGPLCQRVDREFIVGFTAHGVRKKTATEVASKGLPIIAA